MEEGLSKALVHCGEAIVIYDNNSLDRKLRAGWGFSCLLRLPPKTILFDTGADSSTLLHNMGVLGIDPKTIGIVVLSHPHGDHTGGLAGFLKQNSDVTIHMPNSFPKNFRDEVKTFGARVEEVQQAKELYDGIYTTGTLGRWIGEQSLVVRTNKGLAIVTGCAHPGIVNIARKAKEMARDKICLVLGGFHLGESVSEVESVIENFRELGIEKVAPCHCSGSTARRLFQEHYGEDCIECGVSSRVTLGTREEGS